VNIYLHTDNYYPLTEMLTSLCGMDDSMAAIPSVTISVATEHAVQTCEHDCLVLRYRISLYHIFKKVSRFCLVL